MDLSVAGGRTSLFIYKTNRIPVFDCGGEDAGGGGGGG